MFDAMQMLLGLFTGSGLLLMALAFPLIRHWVRPNWIYGFRLPRTVNNPDIWYPANEVAGKWLFGSGVVTVAFSAGLYLLAPGAGVFVYGLTCAIVILLALMVSVVRSVMYLRTL